MADVVKCQQLGNLGKVYIEILCTVRMKITKESFDENVPI